MFDCDEYLLSLEALEHTFVFALEIKSKCLIQACVWNAEQEFCGVSSFQHDTQFRFLLESIHHIIQDNCQKEFLHILRYLEMLNSQFPDIPCRRELVRSTLKLKQSFVLYNILENGSVSNIFYIMDNFFSLKDLLNGLFAKDKANKRLFTWARREVSLFKRLVRRLLTDMAFRQDFFFDECFRDFGESFHKDLLSDIGSYLDQVRECLRIDDKFTTGTSSWKRFDVSRNPALLYFAKLISNGGSKIEESDLITFLKWLFPAFDETLLTIPATSSFAIPQSFRKTDFDKVVSKSLKASRESPPWTYDSFRGYCDGIGKCSVKLERPENAGFPTTLTPVRNSKKRCLRESNEANRKVNKRRGAKAVISPANTRRRALGVDHGKENALPCDCKSSEVETSTFDSPQAQNLLSSGSKFFSAKEKSPRTETPIQLSSGIMDVVCDVNFSDDDEDDGVSGPTDISSGSLQWVQSESTPKTTKVGILISGRGLPFESDSSDGAVSESDAEDGHSRDEMQPCVRMLDDSFVPDLTWCLEESQTKSCSVRLQRLNEMISENGTVCGFHVNENDLTTIRGDDR